MHSVHAVCCVRGCERCDRVGGVDPGVQADAVEPALCGVADPGHALGKVASLGERAVGVHDRDGASAAGWSLCSWRSLRSLCSGRSLNARRPLRAGRSLRACGSLRSGEPAGPWLPRSCARTEGLTWPMLVMTKWLAAPAPAASTDRAITAARIVVRFVVDSSGPALAIAWAAPDFAGGGRSPVSSGEGG